jgi:lipopolysaccharide export system permease protein
VLTFFIVIFLLLMQFLWKYIDDMVGKGLEMSVIGELLLYTAAGFAPLAFPLAILIASLMTFGNLGENNELLALKSAGISLQRIMSPLIVLTIVFSILAFIFANNVLPVIQLHSGTLLRDIRRQRPELSISAGVFNNTIEGYSIKIDYKDHESGLLKGIRIYDLTGNKGNNRVTIADSGYMKVTEDETNMLITLYNGKTYNEVDENERRNEQKKYPHQMEFFDQEEILIPLEGFGFSRTDKDLFASSYQMMTIKQLSIAQDSIKDELKEQNKRVYQMVSNELEKGVKYLVNTKTGVRSGDTLNINPYELYETYDWEEKQKIYEKAISNARSSGHQIRSLELQVNNSRVELRKHLIQWHKKITLAFACFVFFFIGAPLGAIIRKGGLGTPIVVSIVFFLVYYMMSLTGEKLVREGLWSAFTGMWIASIVLFMAGTFLTYKATTDSVILNTDTYINFIKQLFKKKKRPNANPAGNQ